MLRKTNFQQNSPIFCAHSIIFWITVILTFYPALTFFTCAHSSVWKLEKIFLICHSWFYCKNHLRESSGLVIGQWLTGVKAVNFVLREALEFQRSKS